MTNEVSVRFGRKYKPLFVKAKTRYKVIYGGRASAKSFAVASALLLRTYEDDYNILFTRWTMDSAKDSVIPEFKD
jgi:phage terminase large subunit